MTYWALSLLNFFCRSVRDSLRLQGNSFGAFHPIEEAHQSIADLIWNKLKFQFHYNH